MSRSDTVRVLVNHADPLVACGLVTTLSLEPDIEVVDAGAACDVVVADYERGVALAGGLPCRALPNVLVVTARSSEGEIRHALEQGARGYLVLGCRLHEVVAAVRLTGRGLRYLDVAAAHRLADSLASAPPTSREMEVLRLLVDGRSNKLIARELDISVGTVKSHVKALFMKLDASSRTEVATIAERRGLLSLRMPSTALDVARAARWSPVLAPAAPALAVAA